MNLMNHPKLTIAIGFFLVLLGAVLPFLMVMRILEPTYFLSFLSWGTTTSGLFLGLIGSAMWVKLKKND
jgi:multisubunit Na+/H+ antiporter MnhC subunit